MEILVLPLAAVTGMLTGTLVTGVMMWKIYTGYLETERRKLDEEQKHRQFFETEYHSLMAELKHYA